MKTLKTKITVKDIVINAIGLSAAALFVWWGTSIHPVGEWSTWR